jgi:hypothetical protein
VGDALLWLGGLVVFVGTGYHMYQVKFPKPGTRPSFLQVALFLPAAIAFVISGLIVFSLPF